MNHPSCWCACSYAFLSDAFSIWVFLSFSVPPSAGVSGLLQKECHLVALFRLLVCLILPNIWEKSSSSSSVRSRHPSAKPSVSVWYTSNRTWVNNLIGASSSPSVCLVYIWLNGLEHGLNNVFHPLNLVSLVRLSHDGRGLVLSSARLSVV